MFAVGTCLFYFIDLKDLYSSHCLGRSPSSSLMVEIAGRQSVYFVLLACPKPRRGDVGRSSESYDIVIDIDRHKMEALKFGLRIRPNNLEIDNFSRVGECHTNICPNRAIVLQS